MYDWIIESDIRRLRKAAEETRDPNERRMFTDFAERKERMLGARRGDIAGTRKGGLDV